jgi:hypothetical protein
MNNSEENRQSDIQENPGRSPRRWLSVTAGVAVLLLVLLVGTPYLMAWLAKDWLRDNGADQVELQDIDFNPFTGVVVVRELNLQAAGQPTLAIPRLALDLDWSPLFSRQVHVRALSIQGVRLLVEQAADGALSVGGVRLAASKDDGEEKIAEPWDYGILELRIENTVLEYRAPDLKLETGIDELSLHGLATWATEPAPLQFRGTLNGAGLKLEGRLPALADGYGYAGSLRLDGLSLQSFADVVKPGIEAMSGSLNVDSRLDVSYRVDSPLRAEQEGMVSLDGLELVQGGNTVSYPRLEWQGSTTVSASGATDVRLAGSLRGQDLSLALPDQQILLASLEWGGEAALSVADQLTVSTGSRFAGKGLVYAMPSEQFRLQQQGLSWDGKVEYSDGEAGMLQVDGNLSLEKSDVDAVDGKSRLVGFNSLSMDRVLLEGIDAITIENLVITDAELAEVGSGDGDSGGTTKPVPPLQIANLGFDRIEITDRKRVSIDTIESRDARYTAVRSKDGNWRMATILESLPFMGKDEQESAKSEPGEPGSLRVGMLKNTDVVLRMEDYSVRPPFRMQLNAMTVTRDVDTAKPDQDTFVSIEGSTARHDSIEIKGTVRPFATPLGVNLEVDIDGLELPPLSPYAIASIGHRLDSGQLDAKSTLRVDKGKLDGMNSLVMKGLQISPVKGDELQQMESQLAVPLNKGLNMLRDDNDVIRLKLPITGKLDSPDFDVSDAINQAVAKATREGAIASLGLLLQPYGSLITVARYAADKASAVRLDPVAFAPASAELEAERHAYLGKVAGIIEQRPGINLRLCGVATAMDRDALAAEAAGEKDGKGSKAADPKPEIEITDEQLIELADQRDAAVKDFLVARHGVQPGRLVACQPVIDPDEGAVPRVDLLI